MSQELTDEEKALLGEVCVVVSTAVSIHCNVPKEKIVFEDDTRKVFDNNVYKFGHMLLDVHEMYDLLLEYEPLTEFETFSTLADVIRYFFSQLLAKQGA